MTNFQKTEHQATKGIHMAPTFQGLLKCVQLKIFSGIMLECASDLETIPCFLPIHCLPESDRKNVEQIIRSGLSIILKRAETVKWNGKKTISLKTQNLVDPCLAALYNTFSIAASFTDPFYDCIAALPDDICFSVDVNFVPEGESDCCKLDILILGDIQITLFLWKEFHKSKTKLFLRHKKTSWRVNASYGNLLTLKYNINGNKMFSASRELEREVGWPKERMNVPDMIHEVEQILIGRMKNVNTKPYKWISKVPLEYLKAMEIDLEYQTSNGSTLLHILAELNETNLMNCLLGKVLTLDKPDVDGLTPLHRACRHESFAAAKMLIEHGANVNSITQQKDSPLTLLAANKNHDMNLFKLMVCQNANREHENEDFMRPVDLARQSSAKSELIKLLRSK